MDNTLPSEDKEQRHLLYDRLFHWVMALTVLSLIFTSLFPIFFFKFDWVPIHWYSGILLSGAIIFHIIRVSVRLKFKEMWPNISDVKELLIVLRLAKNVSLPNQKYDFGQKVYHWSTALLMVISVVTGGLMLAKIDTFLWKRNPSILQESHWGLVYALHGAATYLLVFLIILHIYFALIPEHRLFLRSIIFGRGPMSARHHEQH